MIELGCLNVNSTESATSARHKLRLTLDRLGYSDILAARTETAFSELFRDAVASGDTLLLQIDLDNRPVGPKLLFELRPAPPDGSFACLKNVFRKLSVSTTPTVPN
jgi:hypothetical protein